MQILFEKNNHSPNGIYNNEQEQIIRMNVFDIFIVYGQEKKCAIADDLYPNWYGIHHTHSIFCHLHIIIFGHIFAFERI